MQIPEPVKKHWPIVVGGVVGLYLLMKYRGGSSAAQQVDNTSAYLAQQANMANNAAQISAASNAQQLAAGVQMAQINAQAGVAQTQANAQLAGATGQAVAGIISAQSMLPAQAINAAMADNQTALQAAAMVAVNANSMLPGAMNAQANQIVATSQQFNSYLNAAGETQASFNANMPLLVNAVGTSAAVGTSSIAKSAANAAQANASSSGSMWSTVGTVAMVAMA